MDLYRVLRVSIYLLVASGAFAICVAEQSPWFLIGVLGFGTLAYLTVDSRRMKPVRMEFAAAMALALLVYTLLPLRETNGLTQHFPAAFAHFLCAIQVLLFFTAFRGPLLLAFCGSTLAVVVISGVMRPDVSLMVRLICFVSATSWTLFIHALWIARETFNSARSASIAAARNLTATGQEKDAASPAAPSIKPPEVEKEAPETPEMEHARAPGNDRFLSERAFWQELAMTAVISIACLLLGIFLYVAAPRLNDRVAEIIHIFRPEVKKSQTVKNNPGTEPDRSETAVDNETGGGDDSTGIKIGDLGPIHENNTPALNAKFDALPQAFVTDNHRLLLRGQVCSEYDCHLNEWLLPQDLHSNNPATDISDPTIPDAFVKTAQPVTRQVIECLSANHGQVYLAAGTIKRISAKLVDQDMEGTLRQVTGDLPDQTELFTQAQFHARDLPANAVAEHPETQRYVKYNCVTEAAAERVRDLARKITEKAPTPLKKVQAIETFLLDAKNCTYTLNLDQLRKANDPLARFLLDPDPKQRRGHCGYFATAFVSLCRFNGIPARIAKGYTGDIPQNTDGPVEIKFRNANAHCWGEVYFKGYGWVPFDTTPGGDEEIASAKAPALPTQSQPGGAQNPAGESKGFVDSVWSSFIGFTGIEQRKVYKTISNFVSNKTDDATDLLAGGSSTGWIGATLAWLAITAAVAWLLHAYVKRGGSRLSIIPHGGRRARAAVAFYNDLLQVLSRRGFVRRPGQTPREFAEFVMKRGGGSFAPVLTVTQIFETVRYGGEEISQEDFNSLQRSLDNLRELTFVIPQGPKT